MREVAKFSECFVCGENNQCGLKARFFVHDDGSVESSYIAEERFVGYADILHGGILASLLDEVMIKAVLKDMKLAVTASMEVKFKHPVMVGQKINLVGRVINRKHRIFKTEGTAEVDGKIVASATGVYIEAKGDLATKLAESLQ
jgi:uncharacterized protein (TIGR00369 family)